MADAGILGGYNPTRCALLRPTISHADAKLLRRARGLSLTHTGWANKKLDSNIMEMDLHNVRI